ncbi:hypothetical protein H2202_011239 [Exophiala xenobiotica]|nr:hypothetical protein H2202_011239 [Exophiala xenobiotica]
MLGSLDEPPSHSRFDKKQVRRLLAISWLMNLFADLYDSKSRKEHFGLWIVVAGQQLLILAAFAVLSSAPSIIVQHTHLPVIADADTGFGGPLNIRRTVELYEHAGVAGLHIEDQVFPKRCGQLKGKDVVDLQVYLERVRSAVEARTETDFLIIARTDARQAKHLGGSEAGKEAFHEGVLRLKAALDVGADMAFMESPRTEEECKELVKACAPKPVLINVLPHGLTPDCTTADCERLGFAAAIYPCTGFIPAMLAMQRSYNGLRKEGSDLKYCGNNRIQNFFEQVGLREAFDFDARIEKFSKKEVEQACSHDES